jgi:molybdenum cofactor biosynthesis enzyme
MTIFAFEEVTRDLLNPPIAAQRALGHAGVNMPLSVWRSLSFDTRSALIEAGAAEQVSLDGVRSLLRGVSLGKVQMTHPLSDPKTSRLPNELEQVLGPWRQLVAYHWPSMRGLHRWVLSALASNPRLLWRAMSEIGQFDRWHGSEALPPIHGLLARCEVRLSTDAYRALGDLRFHAGRAGVLARASGVRAARRLSDVIDAHAEASVGPVELEWGPQRNVGVLWQAHVSTAQGAFSSTASLLAATTAAVAMIDLLHEIDGNAQIVGAQITDEPWMFGHEDSESTLAV